MLRVYLPQLRLVPWYIRRAHGRHCQPVLPARISVLLEVAVWNILFYRISKRSQKNAGNPISVLPRFLLLAQVKFLWVFPEVRNLRIWLFPITTLKIHLKKKFHRKSETCTGSYRCASYVCELFQKRNFDFIAYISGTWARGRERNWDVLLGKWWCGSSLEILDITSIRELVENSLFLSLAFSVMKWIDLQS